MPGFLSEEFARECFSVGYWRRVLKNNNLCIVQMKEMLSGSIVLDAQIASKKYSIQSLDHQGEHYDPSYEWTHPFNLTDDIATLIKPKLILNSVVDSWKSAAQFLGQCNVNIFFNAECKEGNCIRFHLDLLSTIFLCQSGSFSLALADAIQSLEEGHHRLFLGYIDRVCEESMGEVKILDYITYDFKERIVGTEDFAKKLKFYYKIPEPFNRIITPPFISNYQSLFQHMLAATQTETLINRMLLSPKWGALDRTSPSSSSILKFGMLARQFSSGYISYLHQYAVQVPWLKLSFQLDEIEKGTSYSYSRVESLFEAHADFVNSLMQNLFLSESSHALRKHLDEMHSLLYQFQRFMADYPILHGITKLYLKARMLFGEIITILNLAAAESLNECSASALRNFLNIYSIF